MKFSPEMGEIATALAKAQGEIKDVIRDGKNAMLTRGDGKPATYASLESIVASIRPVFSANGLAIVQSHTLTEPRDVVLIDNKGRENPTRLYTATVETLCLHAGSGQWVLTTFSGETIPQGPRTSSVQMGGATNTYLRKYALLALGGLAMEDSDGAPPEDLIRERKSGKTPAQLLTDAVDSCGLTEAEIRAGLDLLGKGWPATDDEARKLAAWLGGKGPAVLRAKLDAANARESAPEAAGKFAAYSGGQPGFMAEIAKHGFSAKGKATYEELASYCEAHGRPRPSAMDADAMGKLLVAIRDRDLATTVCEWVARGEADVSR